MRLRYYLIIALVAGAGHVALSFGIIAAWTERTIVAEADARAQGWARYALARLDRAPQIAAGDAVTPSEYHVVDTLVAYSDVFRFIIAAPDGTPRLLSDRNLGDPQALFAGRAAGVPPGDALVPVTEIVDGGGSRYLPQTYARTVIPVIENGRLVARVEVYADQTARVAEVRRAFWSIGTLIGVLVLLTLAGPAIWIAVLLRRRAQAQADIAQAHLQVLRAERARSEFLAAIGPELRTPLRVILDAVARLRAGASGQARAELTEAIARSAATQSDLVEDLLSSSQADAGATTIAPAPCDLHDFMRDATRAAAAHCADKGLDFTLCLEAPDVTVQADARRLRQILGNLVGNAIKFTETGAITVRVGLDMADYGLTGRMRVVVADTGMGIDPQRLSRVFERFERAGEARPAHPGGAGLGLAVSRALARAMRGDISVESTPGAGSVFTLTLPVAFEARRPPDDLAA